jgi:Cdc6-like AAA superfamily ATPase
MRNRNVSKTSIYVAVQDAFDYSVMMKHASLITGIPGIGKTTALEEIARLNPQATLIRVAAPQGTPRAALSLIADALRLFTHGKSTSGIWDVLESYFSYPAMNYILIFDEAQNLLSTAATNCARWRLKSVPVWLREKGREALVSCVAARIEARGA